MSNQKMALQAVPAVEDALIKRHNELDELRVSADTASIARKALWALGIGFGGFLIWAALAPLDEGVPTPGMVAIDTKRNALYVTTGDNYSEPASATSDAFMAFDLDTILQDGHVVAMDAQHGPRRQTNHRIPPPFLAALHRLEQVGVGLVSQFQVNRQGRIEVGQGLEDGQRPIAGLAIRQPITPFPAPGIGINQHLKALQHAVVGTGIDHGGA